MRDLFVLSTSLVLLAACGGSDALCDADDLSAALSSASPGDDVELGACEISGHFVVPPGIILCGDSRDQSVLRSTGDAPVVSLTPGMPGPRLERLSIVSDGRFGIRASGYGELAIHDVRVEASHGIAIGIDGLDDVDLQDVVVQGPVFNGTPDPAAATHGVVLVDVEAANLATVDAFGFRTMGAYFVRTDSTWTGGAVSQNFGTGLVVEGGSAALTDLSITETISDPARLRSWAGVFHAGATISTTNLTASDNQGYGLLHHVTSSVTHDALIANDNGGAAVWFSLVTSAELSGEMWRNSFAGVFAHASSGLTVRNATIAETREVTLTLENGGPTTLGDGVQLVESTTAIVLAGVVLDRNERAGLLLDLGSGSTAGVQISATRVEVATAVAHGAVAQSGTVIAGWDSGITRVDFDASRDMVTGLSTAGAVGPCEYPAELEMPDPGENAVDLLSP